MGRNYSNKNLSVLEIGNIEFYLNDRKGYSSSITGRRTWRLYFRFIKSASYLN